MVPQARLWQLTARLAVPALVAAALGATVALWPLPEAAALLAVLAVALAALAEPLVGLAVLLLLAPFAALEGIVLPGVLPIDSGQLLLALTLVAWLGRIALRRELRIPRLPVLVALILFIGVMGVSATRAPAPVWAQNELIKWGQVALMLLFVVDLASDRRRLAWVVGMLIAGGVLQAVIGIYQFGLAGDGPPAFLILGRFYRAYGTFQQPNPFAGFVALCLALAIGTAAGLAEPAVARFAWRGFAWLGRYRAAGRLPANAAQPAPPELPPVHRPLAAARTLLPATLAVAVLLGAALVMSWSRGAWFGFAAAAGAMLAFMPRRWWLGLLISAFVLVAGAGLWSSGSLPASFTERLTGFTDYLTFYDVRGVDINDANFSVAERLAHWQAGLAMWQDHFWFGVGIGNYQPAYPDYRLLNWEQALGHAHNIYINFGAETGLTGLAAYLAFWGVVFWQTLRALRRLHGPWRGVALGLLGVWVHLAVHQLFDNLYVDNVHLHIGAMLGVLSVLASQATPVPAAGPR